MRVQSVCAGAGIVFTDDGWRWRAPGEEVSGKLVAIFRSETN